MLEGGKISQAERRARTKKFEKEWYSTSSGTVPTLVQYQQWYSTNTGTVPTVVQYQQWHSTNTGTVPVLVQYQHWYSINKEDDQMSRSLLSLWNLLNHKDCSSVGEPKSWVRSSQSIMLIRFVMASIIDIPRHSLLSAYLSFSLCASDEWRKC